MSLDGVNAMSNAKVSEGGRVVIPAELRARHGIAIGDSLLWVEDEQGLRLVTPHAALRRAQQLAAKYKRQGISEVDEFLRDKRAEAARE
jgi:bifunctional DNA-binding transcriptional regulator/antitoxin component of YhaV-PrlF toxin-antitoxin module